MKIKILLISALAFGCAAWSQSYNEIDAISGASNKTGGAFKVVGGRAYATYAEIDFTFTENFTGNADEEVATIKWGTDTAYDINTLPMNPYIKETDGKKTIPDLSPGTKYYYWIRGDFQEPGKNPEWIEVKSSFTTFDEGASGIIGMRSVDPRISTVQAGRAGIQITLDLPETEMYRLLVSDIRGKEVAAVFLKGNDTFLIQNGTHGERALRPGLYIIRISESGAQGAFHLQRRITIL